MIHFTEVDAKITKKGYNPSWSLCKIQVDGEILFRFRVIGSLIEEGIASSIDEAINDYLDRLPSLEKKKK